MRLRAGKICSIASILALLAASALAHPNLNGAWKLIPTKSDFAGQDVLQTGTVTINERERHIYISRNFNYDGTTQSYSYSFSTDGDVNSTIRNGKAFKSKVSWDHDLLKVRTTDNGVETIELFRLQPDGTLLVSVERSDRKPMSLIFERQ